MPRRPAAARIAGRYKVAAEDFAVEELPAYEPCGAGEHVWLWIEKTGLSTFDAVARLAAELGCRDREIGFAGMKDAQAVTRQWLSVPGADPERLAGLALPGLRVLDVRRHRNKLKLGHLRGNRFRVLVRGAGPEDLAAARAGLAALQAIGVPNYFGEQRFGKRGANLDKGLTILAGNPRKAARRMPKRLLGLVISAVQSEVFNRVLIERIGDYERLRDGDVAWLHRNGACFPIPCAAAEQERCDRFEISPSGPLPGPKLLLADGDAGAIEAAALEALGLTRETFGRMPYGTHDGARRPLRVPLEDPVAEAHADGLQLSFALPRGAYATAVLRELLRDAPWFG